jgi:hypothetical protein
MLMPSVVMLKVMWRFTVKSIMVIVIMVIVIMVSVIMLNVVMINVVAPFLSEFFKNDLKYKNAQLHLKKI